MKSLQRNIFVCRKNEPQHGSSKFVIWEGFWAWCDIKIIVNIQPITVK